ncbi:ankyrin repeat-containing domain protein [Penicillium cataractarum]|uniref:Ankyrin repeat-containing domain protein n=1 Tax=Penicillium cataractarum TaxID=2100454 RepID=A0A9W9VII2_9EURO|nr:ankyrin repeat-containing domain protein [Penicillium cataractarum]KAJ5380695.1 ankyrin repeat-containing domain protein [Penicillium cataractarum]
MAHILKLPNELLDKIVQELEYGEEVNNLSQACRRLYWVASYRLFPGYAIQYTPTGLSRIVTTGNVDSLRKLLASGISFSRYSAMTGYNSPLPEAVKFGQRGIVKLLIDSYGSEITSGSLSDRDTALTALEEDCLDILELLVKTGLSKHDAVQAFVVACELAPLATIEYLVSELGININARADDNMTPIRSAILSGRLEVVKYLVDSGATIDDMLQAGSPTHKSVLSEAASLNHVDVVRFLLEKGASVKGFTADQLRDLVCQEAPQCAALIFERIGRRKTMGRLKYLSVKTRAAFLVLAAALGDEPLFAKLIRLGAGRINWPESPVLGVAASSGHTTIVMALLDMLRENPDALPSQYSTAIDSAIRGNHKDIVIAILDHGAYEWIKTRGIWWLTEAARKGRDSICSVLIKRGALKFFSHATKVTSEKLRAALKLGYALGTHFHGNMAVLRQIHRILVIGCPYGAKVACGVLSGAAGFCNEETLKMLKNRYRHISGSDQEGWARALTSAVRELNPEPIACILRYVDPNFRPIEKFDEEFPPILVLCGHKVNAGNDPSVDVCLDIIRQLLNHGAQVDDLDSTDDSALRSVSLRGDSAIHIAKELIDHGADPLMTEHGDPSALELVIRRGEPKLVELFLKTLEDRGTLEENWSLIKRFRIPDVLAWESYDAETSIPASRNTNSSTMDARTTWDTFLINKTVRKYELRMAWSRPIW